MKKRMTKYVMVPMLVLAMTVSMVFSSAFVIEPAYAGTERSTTYGNAANDGYTDWEFGQDLAGNDITDSAKTISNTVTVI